MEFEIIEHTGELSKPFIPKKCPVGIEGHKWVVDCDSGFSLHLAEGEICPNAYSDSNGGSVCEEAVLFNGDESLAMGPIPVHVKWKSDCREWGQTHINGPCDHDWWWELTPETKT